jgi:hypothetical protein
MNVTKCTTFFFLSYLLLVMLCSCCIVLLWYIHWPGEILFTADGLMVFSVSSTLSKQA